MFSQRLTTTKKTQFLEKIMFTHVKFVYTYDIFLKNMFTHIKLNIENFTWKQEIKFLKLGFYFRILKVFSTKIRIDKFDTWYILYFIYKYIWLYND